MSKHKKSKHSVTYPILGIHCASCEMIIVRKISKLTGVSAVNVNASAETVSITGERHISEEEVEALFADTEYSISVEEKKSLKERITEIGAIVLLILPIFLLLNHFEIFTNGVTVQDNMSLFMVLGLGIVASFSSCIAVAGGLLLGISTRYAQQHPNLSGVQKFVPHIYFNVGRLVSYIVFGAIIGLLGSLLTVSLALMGTITVIASVLMIVIGLQLLQLFPWLNKIRLGLPKKWTEKWITSNESSHKASFTSAFVAGAATFFLPCGFTQAMQLYVLAIGSPILGGITMAVFAIGTLPSFLSIGAFASFLKKEWLHTASIVAGIIVIFLGAFLLPSALTLVGSGISSIDVGSGGSDIAALLPGEFQEVKMRVEGLDYYPHQFEVKVGVPVRWIIDGSGARGCAQILTMPKMKIFERLNSNGDTVIEFMPAESGELPFHCSMAMTTPGAKFIVT
jgi:sulfite exporter TauE/SafE/copper chaperone CopZ